MRATSPGAKPTSWPCGIAPDNENAYTWFTTELANLRIAFRWAADHDDLDVAAVIATYASFLGLWVEQYEPIAWAEELIEPARAVGHPRLGYLFVMAAQCWMAGRIEAAVHYGDEGQQVLDSGRSGVPFGLETLLGGAYMAIGHSERWVECVRAQVAHGSDTHGIGRAALVLALAFAGSRDEAMAAANGLIDAAEATRNPCALSWALLAYGSAFRDADPDRALNALRRGPAIAQDSGNRYTETHLAAVLCRVEAEYGDPLVALDYFAVAIRNYVDSGNTTAIRSPLAILAAFLDRRRRYEPAAIVAGYAFSPLTSWTPEVAAAIAHLREVLGDRTYESLAREGEQMTTAAMVTYALDEIDQARAELNAVAK